MEGADEVGSQVVELGVQLGVKGHNCPSERRGAGFPAESVYTQVALPPGAFPVSQGMGFQLVLILAFLHIMCPFSPFHFFTPWFGECNSNHSGFSLVCFLLCWLGSRSGTSH